MKKLIIIITGLLLLTIQLPAQAVLNLELTAGLNQALPIAVVPFQEQNDSSLPVNISNIIAQDLKNSGRFKLVDGDADIKSTDFKAWKALGVNDVINVSVKTQADDKYKVTFSLSDVYKHANYFEKTLNLHVNPVLVSKAYVISSNNLRRLAHKIADVVYQKLTGERGIFSTKIAYILVQRSPNQPSKYSLMVADADGYNPRAILTSTQPVMSPAWSPNGKSIAYVSFENRRASLFVSDVATGKRRLVTQFLGINGAPAWAPDGRHIAVVLSRGNGTKIFLVDLQSGKLSQLTNGWLIDTEPAFAPDGKSMLFTSDRAGSPQIYWQHLATNMLQRITFVGNYNARASFTPDEKNIVMLHRDNEGFNIAIQNLSTGVVTILVNNCDNQSPSIAPNGRMVIYATHDQNNHGVLALVSTDGKVELTLPESDGEVREPAWGPFI
ncbi:MAG: Tol-Pal system beta propeller repeat protein TolB [Gammaproteobacteria bacterium]|jgi:TolB protein